MITTRCIQKKINGEICNKLVFKKGESVCSECKLGFTDGYIRRRDRKRRHDDRDHNNFRYCASPLCSLRNQKIPKEKMIKVTILGEETHVCCKKCEKEVRNIA